MDSQGKLSQNLRRSCLREFQTFQTSMLENLYLLNMTFWPFYLNHTQRSRTLSLISQVKMTILPRANDSFNTSIKIQICVSLIFMSSFEQHMADNTQKVLHKDSNSQAIHQLLKYMSFQMSYFHSSSAKIFNQYEIIRLLKVSKILTANGLRRLVMEFSWILHTCLKT